METHVHTVEHCITLRASGLIGGEGAMTIRGLYGLGTQTKRLKELLVIARQSYVPKHTKRTYNTILKRASDNVSFEGLNVLYTYANQLTFSVVGELILFTSI